MAQMEVIRQIAQTYGLPYKEEDKIVAKALAKTRGSSNYDKAYRVVADLVERRLLPSKERKALRLDEPEYPTSSRLLHEKIGSLAGNPEDIYLGKGSDSQGGRRFIYIIEAMGLLDTMLTKDYSPLISDLVISNNGEMIVANTLDEIASSAVQVEKGLDALALRYQRGDRSIFPPWPIRFIKFYPEFRITHRRDYQNEPLGFFCRHIEYYIGLRSKSDLKRFDPGLTNALWENAQLDLAIGLLKGASIVRGMTADHKSSTIPPETNGTVVQSGNKNYGRLGNTFYYHGKYFRGRKAGLKPKKELVH